jgi:signal transduction histidine kinase
MVSVLYYLAKKNYFTDSKSSQFYSSKENGSKLTRIEELKRENDELNNEIKFLISKNKRLRFKISEMKNVIKNLQEQKNQLAGSEKKLKELREQKDETLAMVAHDLKNPASTIKNFVELLESYDLSAQEQQDVLAGLIETSSRLVRLANEFSQVISEEYEPFALNKSKFNILGAVESIVKANRVKASKKNIEIRLYQPEEKLEIEIDEGKIKEVVDNFVGNAIKYCPEKSKVDVITKLSNNYITVEVTDNGYGLTEDEVTKAFDKGSKFSTTLTGDETSSGLGLWIAKKIVEEHEGKIFVKSKKGFGSTFSFKIPVK